MPAPDPSFLQKIVDALSQPPPSMPSSNPLLRSSASSYAKLSDDDLTPPTGISFDSAALFEAAVEAAFLVANADRDFDDDERSAFESVVLLACGLTGIERRIQHLLTELGNHLESEGMEGRIAAVARQIKRPENADEVLRIAALLAQVSNGIGEEEQQVLSQLGEAMNLSNEQIAAAIAHAQTALDG
jgi:tellurite resistance protein